MSDKNCNDSLSEVNDMLNNINMSSTEDDNNVSVCANCGKEGSDIDNICNKCKQVNYCNATCKKKHRHKHKKECEEHVRLAAEHAAKLHDEKLFKQPTPLHGDCPICFIRLPSLKTGFRYMACCGKVVCNGCSYAPVYDNQGNKVVGKKCPFCRASAAKSYEEGIEIEKKRVEANDAQAIRNIGLYYVDGDHGYPQDYTKALEFFYRAAELGYALAYSNIGYCYEMGFGVEFDKNKAKNYYEKAAMGGDVYARHKLGNAELLGGNINTSRALKHHLIAVRGGCNDSVELIKVMYTHGHATKEDYAKALQSYQQYLAEIKSDQRDKAAAAHDDYRYY